MMLSVILILIEASVHVARLESQEREKIKRMFKGACAAVDCTVASNASSSVLGLMVRASADVGSSEERSDQR
jgi:hypothetical protein